MLKQILFSLSLLITIGIFTWTALKYIKLFKLTKALPIKDYPAHFKTMMQVAFGQTKIFRRPLVGLIHALVFWGFLLILIGSIEMVIDGLFGSERILGFMGGFYNFLFAFSDIMALFIAGAMIVFLFRRIVLKVKRFEGTEMTHKSHMDANVALTIILLLMISLLGMNTFYIVEKSISNAEITGVYPVSEYLAGFFTNMSYHAAHTAHEINWWAHILLIFFFANYLPYSKHFHVYMSIPNVFLSRLEPLGQLYNMESITKEVKLMMDPDTAFADPPEDEEEAERFGVKDIEDITWKNYMDSLACTQCGRCTDVCPANQTGKLLSPRKIIMNVRARMEEKGPEMIKNGKDFDDTKSLIRDYISEEELWACTTCNACAQECPININHPSIIIDLRRYLVMEESAAPSELNTIFQNIENNGAPWQYPQDDRMNWAQDLEIQTK
ncbi:MAG: Fe-S oxidoreductase [Bacteroidetes bacterium 4572_77]|nr:MAG: Fe-S oxidoreductase [Bacteroidetes bacterium 4572_77]